MKWWNDLWLNESFATFMATKIVDKFYPEWDLWDQFLEDAMNTAMSLDALKTSHPIDVKVNHPSEIREIFEHFCRFLFNLWQKEAITERTSKASNVGWLCIFFSYYITMKPNSF